MNVKYFFKATLVSLLYFTQSSVSSSHYKPSFGQTLMLAFGSSYIMTELAYGAKITKMTQHINDLEKDYKAHEPVNLWQRPASLVTPMAHTTYLKPPMEPSAHAQKFVDRMASEFIIKGNHIPGSINVTNAFKHLRELTAAHPGVHFDYSLHVSPEFRLARELGLMEQHIEQARHDGSPLGHQHACIYSSKYKPREIDFCEFIKPSIHRISHVYPHLIQEKINNHLQREYDDHFKKQYDSWLEQEKKRFYEESSRERSLIEKSKIESERLHQEKLKLYAEQNNHADNLRIKRKKLVHQIKIIRFGVGTMASIGIIGLIASHKINHGV